MHIKYPNITVQLVGEDGNAFNILGKVTKTLKRNRVIQSDFILIPPKKHI